MRVYLYAYVLISTWPWHNSLLYLSGAASPLFLCVHRAGFLVFVLHASRVHPHHPLPHSTCTLLPTHTLPPSHTLPPTHTLPISLPSRERRAHLSPPHFSPGISCSPSQAMRRWGSINQTSKELLIGIMRGCEAVVGGWGTGLAHGACVGERADVRGCDDRCWLLLDHTGYLPRDK